MKYKLLISIFFSCILLTSCFDEDNYTNTKRGNFEALWKILDERYCFFEYKNVDWQEVYERYSTRISEDMSNDDFFDVMAEMLAELKDGHVNLTSKHNMARYWAWFEDYPYNFDANLLQKYYLGKGTDYNIAGGLKYKIFDDNIGYIYYESFATPISESILDNVISRLAKCDGIIIDVRNNGGGILTYSEMLASRFFTEKTLVGYIQHKTGKGHNSFSKPYERHIDPPSNRWKFYNKVVVLTNRKSYSSTNDFVNAMTYAPNAIIIGDRTGGGSGLPFSSEIPNGWSVRFSASPMLNANMQHTELGIDPDIKVDMLESDAAKGIDTIIETARQIIKNTKKEL